MASLFLLCLCLLWEQIVPAMGQGCTNGALRLVTGSTYREGRLEVCGITPDKVEEHWRTVCNSNQEGLAGAVCAQLGLAPEKEVLLVMTSDSNIGQTSSCTVVQNGRSLNCSEITHGTPCNHTVEVTCVPYQDIVTREVNKARNECDADITIINDELQITTERIEELQGNITNINSALDECNANIATSNDELEQCTDTATGKEMMITDLKGNITSINSTLQQCMNNETERIIMNEELKGNITNTTSMLLQCRANLSMTINMFSENNTHTTNTGPQQCNCSTEEFGETVINNAATTLIPILGAVIGLLVVVLMVGAVGWIVTFVKLARSSVPRSKNTAGVHKNESYSLQQAVHDEATPTQDTYSSLGPKYDVPNYTDQQVPPTAGAGKEGDDFYNDVGEEEYMYAMVDKKAKKAPKDEEEDIGDPPIYENSKAQD